MEWYGDNLKNVQIVNSLKQRICFHWIHGGNGSRCREVNDYYFIFYRFMFIISYLLISVVSWPFSAYSTLSFCTSLDLLSFI